MMKMVTKAQHVLVLTVCHHSSVYIISCNSNFSITNKGLCEGYVLQLPKCPLLPKWAIGHFLWLAWKAIFWPELIATLAKIIRNPHERLKFRLVE